MLKENVCSFFENERAVNIFQNAEMYIWFFRTYEKEIKKERKQIFSRLKLLVKMQHTHVKERSDYFNRCERQVTKKKKFLFKPADAAGCKGRQVRNSKPDNMGACFRKFLHFYM
nr:hypothetical protein [Mediterraneibacter faecis]